LTRSGSDAVTSGFLDDEMIVSCCFGGSSTFLLLTISPAGGFDLMTGGSGCF
jgi:hypothetical protein